RPPQRCLRTRVALSRTEESRSEEHDKPNRRQRSDCDDEHHHSIDHFTSHSSAQSSELWRLAWIISEPCRQFVHSLAACSDRERAWSPEHGIPVFHDLEMIFHAEQENGYRGGGCDRGRRQEPLAGKSFVDEARKRSFIPGNDHTVDRPVRGAVSELDVIVTHVATSNRRVHVRRIIEGKRTAPTPIAQARPRMKKSEPDDPPSHQCPWPYLADMRRKPCPQVRVDDLVDESVELACELPGQSRQDDQDTAHCAHGGGLQRGR